MIEVVDDAGRGVTLNAAACRIVSLVPSLTESLFALGCGASLVGVTRYCTEPARAMGHVERVGGTKNPDLSRIRALQPDLVLINEEENRREDFEALEGAGLTLFVSFSRRARDVVGLIDRLGRLTGSHAAAQCMAGALTEVLRELESAPPSPRRRVFCPIWKNPWMSFNHETYADDLLRLAGGDNICGARQGRYCTVSLEEIAAADPEVVLLPDEPYVFAAKDLPSLAPLSATRAYHTGRVHFIDGKALSWYGPRTAAALPYLRRMLVCEGASTQ